MLALSVLSFAVCAGEAAEDVSETTADHRFGNTAPPLGVTETTAALRFDRICHRAGEEGVFWLRYRKADTAHWARSTRVQHRCGASGSRTISRNVNGLTPETEYEYALCADLHTVRVDNQPVDVSARGDVCVDSDGDGDLDGLTTFSTERACDTTVSSESAVGAELGNASPGDIVCLAGGSYELLEIGNIDKPVRDPVTLRGAPGYATSVIQVSFGGSSGLVIERLRAQQIESASQEPADHITIRLNDIGGTQADPTEYSAIHSVGSWENSGQYSITVERNYIHDAASPDREPYGIKAQGNAPAWTVRYNKLERIGDGDYLQTGNPSDWVVDHNWFLGPSKRTNEAFHPDLWQSLDPNDPGTSITFSNNRVHETDVDAEPGGLGGITLGLIFQDINANSGQYHDIRIENNLLNRIAEGDACLLTNSEGLIFRNNTVRAGMNGWRCRYDADAREATAANYTITRNVFANSEITDDFALSLPHLDCNAPSACDAVIAGSSENVTDEPRGFQGLYGRGSVRGWSPGWSADGWYRAESLSFPAGHDLAPADFPGWPFE